MRHGIALAVFALVVVGFSAPVSAKNVCLSAGSSTTFVFSHVKIPGKGKSAPLVGQLVGTPATPVSGTMTMSGDGKSLAVGIFAYGMIVAVDQNSFTATWVADPKTLAGSARFDNTGDMRSDGDLNLEAVDCKTVTIP